MPTLPTAVLLALAGTLGVAACGSDDDSSPDADRISIPVTADDCIVRLHGKGETGTADQFDDGVAVLAPTGPSSAWDGREWRYETPDELAAGLGPVRAAIDGAGCERVVMHGFSNGASFAAAALCAGETLSGRLIGAVIDDPVTDAAVVDCGSAPDVEITLYWTGALDVDAPPGTDCEPIDWTCAGGFVRGVDVYGADLGVEPTPSPYDEHRWFVDAPEPADWLAGATG